MQYESIWAGKYAYAFSEKKGPKFLIFDSGARCCVVRRMCDELIELIDNLNLMERRQLILMGNKGEKELMTTYEPKPHHVILNHFQSSQPTRFFLT